MRKRTQGEEMRTLAILLGVLLLAIPAIADTTATITGTVTHEGLPLAGVVVRASSPQMQGTRSTTSDVNGRYAIIAVPPGDYTVAFALGEMSPASTIVHAGLGQTARADAELRDRDAELPGAASSVPAAVETSGVQGNIRESIVDLLPVGRDLSAVVNLIVGGSSIAGLRPTASTWLLDDGLTNDLGFRGASVDMMYVEDAIRETAVLTAAIPPQYGRFAGGVVNAITSSGGNVWSGSLRDSVSNPSWTDPSPYQNISNTDETEQLFEGTLGGSIRRDQLWFFAAGRKWDDTKQNFFVRSPSYGFTTDTEDRRWEAKLTGEALGRHSVTAARFDKRITDENYCYNNCIEQSTMAPARRVPREVTSVQYTGVLTDRLVAEAFWSAREVDFKGGGGETTDQVMGTRGHDWESQGRYGAPTFCAVCGPREERETSTYGARIGWYLSSEDLGSHTVSAGFDHLDSDTLANNHQSGSDFVIYTFTPQHLGLQPGEVFQPTIVSGDEISWWPVVVAGRPADHQMDGFYVNDRWDIGARWSVNVGMRYDVNDIVDEAGTVVSDATALQPRLGAAWDLKGNGRYRLHVSYGQYFDLITNGQASAAWPGGAPQQYVWLYDGPDIEGLPTFAAFARLFDWFNSQCDAEGHCGTGNMEALIYAEGGGSTVQFDDSLRSTTTDEATIGFSLAAGANAFLRIDAIRRDWSDFFRFRVTQETGQTTDLFGNPMDVRVAGNYDDGLEARYDAIMLQGAYRFGERWLLGGTWNGSATRSNAEPADGVWLGGTDYYPELTNFPMHNPVRETDRQALRAWLTYTLATRAGNFDVSLLESFDSGNPYSIVGYISTEFDPAARSSYAQPPLDVSYYFSGTKVYHFDDVTSTDLGVRYQLPLVRLANVFFDLTVANVFNEDAQTGGNLLVTTRYKGQCPVCVTFNPYTDTPVEGVHYRKGPKFGQATSVSHYQMPRTYSFSAGVRF